MQVVPRDIRYLSLGWDLGNEFMRLWIFFVVSKDKNSIASVLSILSIFDRALNDRAVTVPSDEPLCIMTLLSLDSKPIVTVDTAEDRMQQVWKQIAKQYNGIPAKIIFIDFPRLISKGWAWAPKSLLQGQKELLGSDAPPVVWNDEQGGEIVEDGDVVKGLKVRYLGLKLEKRTSPLADRRRESGESWIWDKFDC